MASETYILRNDERRITWNVFALFHLSSGVSVVRAFDASLYYANAIDK